MQRLPVKIKMQLLSSVHDFHPGNEWLIPSLLLDIIPHLSNVVSHVTPSPLLDDLPVQCPTENDTLLFKDASGFLKPRENRDH